MLTFAKYEQRLTFFKVVYLFLNIFNHVCNYCILFLSFFFEIEIFVLIFGLYDLYYMVLLLNTGIVKQMLCQPYVSVFFKDSHVYIHQ